MRATFLPSNFQRLMYHILQNLKQGNKSVEDYTTTFYQLLARNKIHETKDQLMVWYIRGLRVKMQNTINMLDPTSMHVAHQRALIINKQQLRTAYNTFNNNNSNAGNREGSGTTGNNTTERFYQPDTSGFRCFTCDEIGHRQLECNKAGKKTVC